MVGRNDPCPCGSGKKYKRCCAGENKVSVQELVDNELELIINNYFRQDLSRTDKIEFERLKREWTRQLKSVLTQDRLLEIISEYFVFVARRDLWKRYLIKLLNGPIRGSVREVLEQWQDPVVLVGKIVESNGNLVIIEEILGNERFQLEIKDDMPPTIGAVILGVVLRDNRRWVNGVFIITGYLYIENPGAVFENSLITLAESSQIENRYDFFKKHLVDVYHLLNKEHEVSVVEDEINDDLTGLQQQAVSILEEHIETEDLLSEEKELLKNILIMYLLTKQPNFRKPEILAAATVLVAIEIGICERLFYTQAEIAERFKVSVASMRKHADSLGEFAFEMSSAMQDEVVESPKHHYAIGTDPLITESVNWEMFCKMSSEDFETFEEAQAFMNKIMNEPFKPKDNKQNAQRLAYEAYEAKTDKERHTLAEEVLKQHPNNIDGLLLKAERTKVKEEKHRLFQSAIKLGEVQFDNEDIDNPWRLVTNRPYMRAVFAYGVTLFEEKRYEEAAQNFDKLLKLNPDDNQGARYLAISSFIHAGKHDKAREILDDYDEESEHDATLLYLDWYLEAEHYGEASVEAMILFSVALDVNPYVKMMLHTKPTVIPYPKALNITSGTIEEAEYIWKLLQ